MKAVIDWRGERLAVDFSRGRSLAIALDPHGRHPAFFADSDVSARPLAVGGFVGDMASGGSCNAEVIAFSPHSHGTHTECVGHISKNREAAIHTIDQNPTLMRLLTISQDMLEEGEVIPAGALGKIDFGGQALALRTLPNDAGKQWRNYDEQPDYPVLSGEAMRRLASSSLLHLLLDTPSLDRADSAALANHAAWWGFDQDAPPGVPDATRRSVTEMIFVPDDIPDGDYWLQIEMAPIVSDAVPSRPVIYPLKRLGPITP